jgi:hypothetical protein
MRRQRIFLGTLVLAALLPAALHAQQQGAQHRGTWTLNAQASDNINTKINEAIGRMNVVVRQIARPRLRATNAAYPRLVITHDATSVRVDMAGRPSVSSPANGQPVLWERNTGAACTAIRGDCVQVTTQWENGRLRQTFQAEDGRRVNVYSVSPDGGTLTMAVTITSDRLPDPLTYNLVYDRAN